MDGIYRKLLKIPLLSGVSYQRMLDMIGHTHLHFIKHHAGHVIMMPGEPCESLYILMDGSAEVCIERGNHTLKYTLTGPDVLFATSMFGRQTRIPGLVTARTEVSVVTISKNEYLQILRSDDIFLLNLMNLLSAAAQRANDISTVDIDDDGHSVLRSLTYATVPSGATDILATLQHRDGLTVLEAKNQAALTSGEELIGEK